MAIKKLLICYGRYSLKAFIWFLKEGTGEATVSKSVFYLGERRRLHINESLRPLT